MREAQFRLGSMYYKGEGVPQDYVEAYIWYSVAAASVISAKKNMAEAKALLTPEQLAEAQKRVTQLLEQINANKE